MFQITRGTKLNEHVPFLTATCVALLPRDSRARGSVGLVVFIPTYGLNVVCLPETKERVRQSWPDSR